MKKQLSKKVISMLIAFAMVIAYMPMDTSGVYAGGKKNISTCSFEDIPTQILISGTYPLPIVKDGSKILEKDVDYFLNYANNTSVGTGEVSVFGKGSYEGYKKINYNIVNDMDLTTGFTLSKIGNVVATKAAGSTSPIYISGNGVIELSYWAKMAKKVNSNNFSGWGTKVGWISNQTENFPIIFESGSDIKLEEGNLFNEFSNNITFNDAVSIYDSAENVRAMFAHAESFNENINNLDFSKVKKIASLLQAAENFENAGQKLIMDVSGVTDSGGINNLLKDTKVKDIKVMNNSAPNITAVNAFSDIDELESLEFKGLTDVSVKLLQPYEVIDVDAGNSVVATKGAGEVYNSFTPGKHYKVRLKKEATTLTIEHTTLAKTYDGTAFTLADLGSKTATKTDGSPVSGNWGFEGTPDLKSAGNRTVQVKFTSNDADYADETEDITVNIAKKDVSITGIVAQDKVYDGNSTVTLDSSGASLNGKVGSDDLTVDASSVSAVNAVDANVGNNKAVTLTGNLGLSGADAGNYNLQGQPSGITVNITPANVTGTPTAGTAILGQTLNQVSLSQPSITLEKNNGTWAWKNPSDSVGTAGSQTHMVVYTSGTGNYNNAEKNINITVNKKPDPGIADRNISHIKTDNVSHTVDVSSALPTDAGTFSLVKGTPTGDTAILQSSSISTDNELVYQLTGTGNGGDSVTIPLTLTTENYQDANTNVIITLADKYDPVTSIEHTTLTKRYDGQAVTLADLGNMTANKKGADGGGALAGAWSFEGTPDLKSAGTRTVQVKFTVSAPDDARYGDKTENINLNITKKDVTVDGITAEAKVYDGSAEVDLDITGANIVGKVGSDDVTIDIGVANINADNADVGNNKPVTVTNAGLTGADAGNYNLSAQPSGITVNFTPAQATAPTTSGTNKYGQKLSDVTLNGTPAEGTWTWVDGNTTLDTVGTQNYEAEFTPANGNYKSANKDVSVTVQKADAVTITPVSKSYKYDSTASETIDVASLMPVDANVISVS